jgi:hypothetical protein
MEATVSGFRDPWAFSEPAVICFIINCNNYDALSTAFHEFTNAEKD